MLIVIWLNVLQFFSGTSVSIVKFLAMMTAYKSISFRYYKNCRDIKKAFRLEVSFDLEFL